VPYIEITRKIVIAIKYLKTPYLIEIGGTGSLSIPGTQFGTAIDSEDFWVAYFQHAADSKAYISYAETRFPKFATLLHRYRDIRQTPSQDRDQEDLAFLNEMRSFAKSRILESYFIMACRASLLFFEGNTELEWTFLSPPPGFKPGPRTGKYVIGGDAVLPVEGDQNPPWEGRLLGITVRDLAGVIVDECEGRKMKGKHWTVWTPKEDAVDEPIPNIYGSLNELEQK
jgi:putative NADH-flavin reductase